MYLSVDDARSDFFLAGAAYLLGGFLIDFVVRAAGGLLDNEIGRWVVTLAGPLLIIAAMPLYLMRYRGEAWRLLWTGGASSAGLGAGFGGLVALGAALGSLLGGSSALDSIPFLSAADSSDVARLVLGRLVEWLSLATLLTFTYRRAEYAFRPISERLEVLVRYAAIATLGTAGVASLLLLPAAGGQIGLIGAPIGFGAAWLVATRVVPPTGMGERWQVWSPLILLAVGEIGILTILGDSLRFLVQARSGGMVTAFGLLGIMVLAARRGGAATFGMAAVIALASPVTAFGSGI